MGRGLRDDRWRRRAVPLALLAALLAPRSDAAELTLHIVDAGGAPGAQLAVLARPVGSTPAAAATRTPVRLVQQFQAFAPEVTPVAVGTTVEFPNLDRMRHHVYSFSATKAFEIRLYSGDQIPEITFDRPGAVAIGCNIHDWMEGYVYVTEAPYFAGTDEHGTAVIADLPPGDYQLSAWHPTFTTEVEIGPVTVVDGAAAESLALPARLQPFSQHRPEDDPLLTRFKGSRE